MSVKWSFENIASPCVQLRLRRLSDTEECLQDVHNHSPLVRCWFGMLFALELVKMCSGFSKDFTTACCLMESRQVWLQRQNHCLLWLTSHLVPQAWPSPEQATINPFISGESSFLIHRNTANPNLFNKCDNGTAPFSLQLCGCELGWCSSLGVLGFYLNTLSDHLPSCEVAGEVNIKQMLFHLLSSSVCLTISSLSLLPSGLAKTRRSRTVTKGLSPLRV